MNPDADTHPGPEPITAHPLIRSYLHDLDRTLAGAEDRREVVDAVTDHIIEAADGLTGPPTTEQVQDILTGLGPVERIAAAGTPPPDRGGNTETEIVEARKPDGAWLSTPSGIVALVALILSVVLPPLFFPLAGLALVLGIVALVRRRPRPRSAWVVTIISGVLLLVVLAIGILASVFLFATTEESTPGVPNPAVTSPAVTSVPAEQP